MKQVVLLLSGLVLFGATAQAQWVNQPVALPPPSSNIIMKPSVVDANVVWTGMYDAEEGEYTQQFCRTVNGGSSWTVGTVSNLNANDFITSVYGVNATTAWVTVAPSFPVSGGKLLKTTDGGATWVAPSSSGQFSNTRSAPFLISFFDATNGVAVGNPVSSTSNFEIFTTANAGDTWQQVVPGTLPNLLAGEEVVSLLSPVAHSGNTIWFGTDEGRVFRTTDRGFTWSVSNPELPGILVGLSFRNATNGLAEDEEGNLARTTDGGLTWTPVTPTGPLHVTGLDNVPGTNTYVSVGLAGQVGGPGSSYSTNDGQTWTAIESTTNHLFVDFVSTTAGWSGCIGIDASDKTFGNGVNKYNGLPLATNAALAARAGVSTYPNPSANGRFIVQAKTLTTPVAVRVLDELGRATLQQTWGSPQTAPLQLDLNGRATGVYVLELTTPDGPVRQKLVVR